MDWLRENVLPTALGGKPKEATEVAMAAPAAPATGTLSGGRRRRRSHRGRRHHRKTKKHSRR